MYIVDGIAYAGEPKQPVTVDFARVVADYTLLVWFNSGEQRLFDATYLLEYPAFAPLKDSKVFADFVINHGVITWLDGELDVAPESVYERSEAYASPAAA